MKIVAGGESYAQPEDLTNREIMDLEKATGLTFKEWNASLMAGSMTAITALVYLCRKREEPGLTFDAVEFNVDSFDIELSVDEAVEVAAKLEGDELDQMLAQLPDEQRAEVVAGLDPTKAPPPSAGTGS